ncbi:MAG: ABC transporter permease subunit [Candidatus Omnitrophica bacterium]|nr:ABC transporter permease subunit [Candidatus Omnitrophota bacterium]
MNRLLSFFPLLARRARKKHFELICILPLLIFLCVLTVVPIARTVLLSLEPVEGNGLTMSHYRELFAQEGFRLAMFHTVSIAFLSLSIEIGLGFLFALILSKSSRVIRFLRPVFILPLAIPTAVVGVMMSYLFSGQGWINRILMDLGVLNEPVYWMSGGWRSIVMVSLADSWKVTPIVMLILLSGLQSIDPVLYKAARIDGAGVFYTFRRITLPLLVPSITAAVIIRGVDAFRIFAVPLILMGQNLKVIGTFAYLEYQEYNNPYTSAASSVILLGMILCAVLIYLKTAGRKGIAGA